MSKVPSLKELISKTIDFEDNQLPQHNENLSVLAGLKGLSFPKDTAPSLNAVPPVLPEVPVQTQYNKSGANSNMAPSQSVVVGGVRTPVDMSGAVQDGTRFGKTFGKTIPTSPNSMAVAGIPEKMTPAMEFNTQEQMMYGTPQQQEEAKFELAQNAVSDKPVTGLTFAQRMELKQSGYSSQEELEQFAKESLNDARVFDRVPSKDKGRVLKIIKTMNPNWRYKSASQYQSGMGAEASFNSAETILDEVIGIWNNTEPNKTPTEAWVKGLFKKAGSITQLDQWSRTYEDTVDSSISTLSRALGEKGVLTDFDIARVRKALPTLFTTKEIGTKKFQVLKNILTGIKEGTIDAYRFDLDKNPNAESITDYIVNKLDNPSKGYQPKSTSTKEVTTVKSTAPIKVSSKFLKK